MNGGETETGIVAVEDGTVAAAWSDVEMPDGGLHVRPYNDTFVILRQSGLTHFEKPFLYLVFGRTRALLVDTGAPGIDLSRIIDALVDRRAATQRIGRPDLVVAHTHGHSDHVAGDARFAGQPGVTMVGTSVEAISEFFHLGAWPGSLGWCDLGDRVLDVIPVPGHDQASIAFYDRRTGILLSGDVLYPGRLYVRDADAFRDSVHRLVEFTRARPVAHILGAHIENTSTPFRDYPEGTASQPDEHGLPLGRAHLLELADALDEMAPAIVRRRVRDFTIWPVEE
jgi:hydroxyacylglutathione hydrolase